MLAVNDAYLWAPFADVCYFADTQWWQWQTEGRPKPELGLSAAEVRQRFAEFRGQKCSIHTSGTGIEDPAVHILRNKNFPINGVGVSLDPEELVTGSNSGCQALNVAVLMQPRLVLLLGIDGGPNAEGKRHFFGDHPVAGNDDIYPTIRNAFREFAKAVKGVSVRIINCSPGSAVNAFERMELRDALRL